MTDQIDLTVIAVERAADLPSGKLQSEMPTSGVVYVYHAPHTIAGGAQWKVIVLPTTTSVPSAAGGSSPTTQSTAGSGAGGASTGTWS